MSATRCWSSWAEKSSWPGCLPVCRPRCGARRRSGREARRCRAADSSRAPPSATLAEQRDGAGRGERERAQRRGLHEESASASASGAHSCSPRPPRRASTPARTRGTASTVASASATHADDRRSTAQARTAALVSAIKRERRSDEPGTLRRGQGAAGLAAHRLIDRVARPVRARRSTSGSADARHVTSTPPARESTLAPARSGARPERECL